MHKDTPAAPNDFRPTCERQLPIGPGRDAGGAHCTPLRRQAAGRHNLWVASTCCLVLGLMCMLSVALTPVVGDIEIAILIGGIFAVIILAFYSHSKARS